MATEEAAAVLEDVKDLVEDTADLVEVKTAWLANTNAKLFLAGLCGTVLGASAAYLLSAKVLKTKYQKIADEQIQDVKNHYTILNKTGEFASLDKLAAKYHGGANGGEQSSELSEASDIITQEGYTSYEKVPSQAEEPPADKIVEEPVPEVIHRNIFEDRDVFASDDPETYFDPEEEEQRRLEHPDEPYVVTLDEFNANEPEYTETSLTYYDGDEVLVDERDQPVPNEAEVVGEANLLRFGHGSRDKNVVYICNNKLQLMIEVCRSDAKYAEEVLGFRHSDESASPRLKRFRNYD